MRKWMLVVVGTLFMVDAQAGELFCGYKDYFHLSDKTHPGIYVVGGYNDSDVILQIVGPRSFVIRDTPQCQTGYAHVTAAYDAMHWCVLNIKDGPYMNHPTVSASCSGMRYRGISYDGFGSYSYTVKLD
ncbi:hypothetical protein [Legionella spiritensis]|uniref:hypothetical protein n=1 Tax=Legionella spiritensis TaxID=452 RepID=UPI000F6F7148|nr:hypothetical protein [Legionella spiritensis]VEG91357.1 Uncharacterised protein [Legionella spiritensis]